MVTELSYNRITFSNGYTIERIDDRGFEHHLPVAMSAKKQKSFLDSMAYQIKAWKEMEEPEGIIKPEIRCVMTRELEVYELEKEVIEGTSDRKPNKIVHEIPVLVYKKTFPDTAVGQSAFRQCMENYVDHLAGRKGKFIVKFNKSLNFES